MTSRRVAVNNAFVDRFIDKRNRREQHLGSAAFISAGDRGAKLLDRGAEFTTIAPIYVLAFPSLTNAL